jgi:hypothetical protein
MIECLEEVEVLKFPTSTTPLVPCGLDRRETMGNREAGVVCQQSKGCCKLPLLAIHWPDVSAGVATVI